MAQTLAQLKDADISLTLEQQEQSFHVVATRFDGIGAPADVLDEYYESLGDAIKAIMVFFVSEWESVFVTNRLCDRMAQAITAA